MTDCPPECACPCTMCIMFGSHTPRCPQKRCSKCEQLLAPSQFARHKFTLDGLQSWCRSCKAKGMRQLRAARKEQL